MNHTSLQAKNHCHPSKQTIAKTTSSPEVHSSFQKHGPPTHVHLQKSATEIKYTFSALSNYYNINTNYYSRDGCF